MAIGFATEDIFGALSAGLILYGMIRGDFSMLHQLMSTKAFLTISAIAYAIYLVHEPVLMHILPLFQHDVGTLRGAGEILIATLIPTILIALFAHQYLEKPFLSVRDSYRDHIVVDQALVELP